VNFACTAAVDAQVATVTAVGDIDLDATARFRQVLQDASARTGVTSVVVDLAAVTFADSTALGVLLAARKAAHRHGATLSVRNPGPMVAMVLRITGLYDELVTEPVTEPAGG